MINSYPTCAPTIGFQITNMAFWLQNLLAPTSLIVFRTGKLQLKIKKLIDIIYLDCQKAFDSLVHNNIMAELSSYGLRYELLSWSREFLTGRMQKVVIDGVLSNPIKVLSGVVQGSDLGPLIFILFIDDITDCMDISEVNPTS